jgi:hypothetical protein
MPPKTMSEAELVAFYSRPYSGPGGAFKPSQYYAAAEKMAPKNCTNLSASLPQSVAAAAPVINAADRMAENQRMYREATSFSLDSPVASAKAAVPSSTPATQPKPPRPPIVRDDAESVPRDTRPPARPQDVPDFLKNTDLHGLEPALSVRTRILLASHAMNRMNMQLDIAKSFAIAGYFPRVRFAWLLLLLLLCSSCILADQRSLGSTWLIWLLQKESYYQEMFVFRAVDAMNKCVCARTVVDFDLFFQFYNDAKDALLNLRHDVVTRMLNCVKVLEEAGNKGVLQVRALETMKKTRAVNPPKADQPKKTGITVPNTALGQPVAEDVGIQTHAAVADHLRKKQAAYDAKFVFKCPLQACGQRCSTLSGLKIHWRCKHDGVPFPETATQVQMPLPATNCDAVVSPCAEQAQSNTAVAVPLLPPFTKRAKVQHVESAYETCSICPNSRYLKINRGVHIASAAHNTNASAAK